MPSILKFIDTLSEICGKIASPMPLIAAMCICYEIGMRYFLHKPTIWASEATIILCATCYFLGGAVNIKNDVHVRVDIAYNWLKPRTRAAFDCFTFLFFAMYIGMMLWLIWPYMVQSIGLRESTQTAWNPPLWPLKVVMFTGFTLVALQGLAGFVRNIYHVIWGKTL